MAKNDPDFFNKLIRLVRENKILYDSEHPDYRRKIIRMETWRKVARELAVTPRFLRTKWYNMRHRYVQQLKGGTNLNRRRKLYTEDLSFLNVLIRNNTNIPALLPNMLNNNNQENSPRAHASSSMEITLGCSTSINGKGNGYGNNNGYSGNSPDISEVPVLSEVQSPEPFGSPVTTQLLTSNGMVQINNSSNSLPTGRYNSGNDNDIECVEDEVDTKDSPDLQIISFDFPKKETITAPQSNTTDSDKLFCLSLVGGFKAMARSERERVKCEIARVMRDAKYIDNE